MISIVCGIKGLLQTSWSFLWTGDATWISGHDMVEQPKEQGQPDCIQILKCSLCEETHLGWTECAQCGHGYISPRLSQVLRAPEQALREIAIEAAGWQPSPIMGDLKEVVDQRDALLKAMAKIHHVAACGGTPTSDVIDRRND